MGSRSRSRRARPSCRPPSSTASRSRTTATTPAWASTAPAASASSRSRRWPKLQTACSTTCARRDGGRRPTRPTWSRRAPVSSSSCSSTTRSTARSATRAASARSRISPTRSAAARAGWSSRAATFDGEGVKADVDFGPTLMLNRNRCILCTRCVRFMREIDGDAQIGIVARGNDSQIATFNEQGVHSLLSGNLMDVCPVGAITTRDYRFKSRPWDNPDAVDTICTLCSKGCNTTAWIKAKPEWAKGARLVRLTPRYEPDVNGYWMCDIGRFDYHWIEGEERLRRRWCAKAPGTTSRRRGTRRSRRWASAPPRSRQSAITFLVSAHASNEEIFLIERLAERDRGELEVEREAAARGHEVPRAARGRAQRQRRARSRPAGGRRQRRRARPRAPSATRSKPDRCRRSTCSIPVPPDRSATLSWIVAARAVRQALAAGLPGRADVGPRARGRHRAAGLGVGREGRHLHERSGPRAGGGEGVRRARRRDGRPRDLRARGRGAGPAAAVAQSAAEVRAAIAAHLADEPGATRRSTRSASRSRWRPGTGCRRRTRPSAGSGTSCSRKSTRRSGMG